MSSNPEQESAQIQPIPEAAPPAEFDEAAHLEAATELGSTILRAARNRGTKESETHAQTQYVDTATMATTLENGGIGYDTATYQKTDVNPRGEKYVSLSLFKAPKSGEHTARDIIIDYNGATEKSRGPLAKRPERMSPRRLKAATRLVEYKFGVKRPDTSKDPSEYR